jgi:hypothetical protein
VEWFRGLLRHLTGERAAWFGAGLSIAAVGVVGYQLLIATLLVGPLPGPPAPALVLGSASPTPTRTPRPSATPFPTNTPRPTSTPRPTNTPRPTPTPTRRPTRTPTPTATPTPPSGVADVVATLTAASPDVMVGAVATFVARTRDALDRLAVTPRPR